MKTDIQIAQEATMLPITEIAEQVGLTPDDLEMYGKYKAKLSDECMERLAKEEDGKLVLVTAINPTPAGEGKTTTSVGLGQAFAKLGKKAVLALREPSLGPCFGIKVVLRAVAMPRSFLWKISICISPEIFMRLLLQITCWQPF